MAKQREILTDLIAVGLPAEQYVTPHTWYRTSEKAKHHASATCLALSGRHDTVVATALEVRNPCPTCFTDAIVVEHRLSFTVATNALATVRSALVRTGSVRNAREAAVALAGLRPVQAKLELITDDSLDELRRHLLGDVNARVAQLRTSIGVAREQYLRLSAARLAAVAPREHVTDDELASLGDTERVRASQLVSRAWVRSYLNDGDLTEARRAGVDAVSDLSFTTLDQLRGLTLHGVTPGEDLAEVAGRAWTTHRDDVAGRIGDHLAAGVTRELGDPVAHVIGLDHHEFLDDDMLGITEAFAAVTNASKTVLIVPAAVSRWFVPRTNGQPRVHVDHAVAPRQLVDLIETDSDELAAVLDSAVSLWDPTTTGAYERLGNALDAALRL